MPLQRIIFLDMDDKNQRARKLLMDWVKLQHRGQKIKKSGKPYFSHVLAVAEMAGKPNSLRFEIGLCHDLLEDTDVTTVVLDAALKMCGYDKVQREYITTCVLELTDHFTKTEFPDLRKKERKQKEASRLLTIHPDAQTVKYCDLIYNMRWMKKYDQEGFEKYLIKKSEFVEALDGGDPELREKALSLMHNELKALEAN